MQAHPGQPPSEPSHRPREERAHHRDPERQGVQVVITIQKMDHGGVYINCGGPDPRPLGGVGDNPPSLDMAVNGIPAVISIAVEELLKASARR
jgi:hypothetical protein